MSALPKIFIIGDSISIGYTPFVREMLEGRMIVERVDGNAASTETGLRNLDEWLGDTQWDVIHFNWGLHDMKYINDAYEMVPVREGRQWVPFEQYAENLNELVKRIKERNAKLIFATTTPVPPGVTGRNPGEHVKYNEAAVAVMMANGVPVNDLCGLMKVDREAKGGKQADVHYTDEGSELMARQVVASIESVFAE